MKGSSDTEEDDFSRYINLDSQDRDYGLTSRELEVRDLNQILPVDENQCGVITRKNQRCRKRRGSCNCHSNEAQEAVPRKSKKRIKKRDSVPQQEKSLVFKAETITENTMQYVPSYTDNDDDITSMPVGLLFGQNWTDFVDPQVERDQRERKECMRLLQSLRTDKKFMTRVNTRPLDNKEYFNKFISLALHPYLELAPGIRWKVILAERESNLGSMPLNQ